jgi:hypothetical protein
MKHGYETWAGTHEHETWKRIRIDGNMSMKHGNMEHEHEHGSMTL